jgi:hypothetical protein
LRTHSTQSTPDVKCFSSALSLSLPLLPLLSLSLSLSLHFLLTLSLSLGDAAIIWVRSADVGGLFQRRSSGEFISDEKEKSNFSLIRDGLPLMDCSLRDG